MTLRFDEYALAANIGINPVDQFDGLVVEVGLPPGWAPVDSSPGAKVWIWRGDPRIADFGANAVLTMNTVEAQLEAVEVFAMLCEQQVQMVPGAVEAHRASAVASEGPGLAGSLALNIESQFGTIGSVSLTRVISGQRQTRIGQLTITALRDSPVDWDTIWFYVKPGAGSGTTGGGHGGAPISPPQGGPHEP